jgi:hypothetical protein
MNLDEKRRRTDNLSDFIIEELDAFGMENIFEQMKKYKGKRTNNRFVLIKVIV